MNNPVWIYSTERKPFSCLTIEGARELAESIRGQAWVTIDHKTFTWIK